MIKAWDTDLMRNRMDLLHDFMAWDRTLAQILAPQGIFRKFFANYTLVQPALYKTRAIILMRWCAYASYEHSRRVSCQPVTIRYQPPVSRQYHPD